VAEGTTETKGLTKEIEMYDIEKIDIMEKLLRKVGSNHEPEALGAAHRLRVLSARWSISLDTLHSTSSQPTEVLRRRARQFWEREDTKRHKTSKTSNETKGEN